MSTGMPAGIWLNKFGVIVEDYFGHTSYQVGSSLTSKDWRDVDVRLILPDDEFAELFGKVQDSSVNPKLAAVTLAFSALGAQMTGLPIDFQIQSQSHANGRYGDQMRSALIEASVDGVADARVARTGRDRELARLRARDAAAQAVIEAWRDPDRDQSDDLRDALDALVRAHGEPTDTEETDRG